VVDNGSLDHTRQVVADFKKVLGHRLIDIPLDRNTGTTYSRNLALKRARGRFICVMDSDAEILTPDLLAADPVFE
jgi:glycosyltransferase involved in cell wall biosynthesis